MGGIHSQAYDDTNEISTQQWVDFIRGNFSDAINTLYTSGLMPGGLNGTIFWKSDNPDANVDKFLEAFPTPQDWYSRALGDSWLVQNNPVVFLTGVTGPNGVPYHSEEDFVRDFPNVRTLIEVNYPHIHDNFWDRLGTNLKGSFTGLFQTVKSEAGTLKLFL